MGKVGIAYQPPKRTEVSATMSKVFKQQHEAHGRQGHKINNWLCFGRFWGFLTLPILPLASTTDFAGHPVVLFNLYVKLYRMGRVKLKIKRLENTNGRQATYAKRKNGIMKKANELSILCDIDIILLMFSPTGKPSLCRGMRSIEEVIAKFAQLTPQERAKRKLESLEALKKTFKKLDHDVNIQEFLGTSTQTVEDLTSQANALETQLSEIHKRLSYWTNLDKINSVEHLGQMEDSLRESLNQIRTQKENVQKQQLMSLECSSQFQQGMHIPFTMGAEQQLQPFSWIPNNDGQHLFLPEDPHLLAHRDVECSTTSSLGSYPGYFGTGKNSEIHNSGQENGMMNELSRIAPLRVQLGGQYPYLPYNLNLMNDNTKFQTTVQMNQPEHPADYHVNGSFETPRPGFETAQHSWASTSGPCPITMFDEHLYNQQPN
ncbi:agamous-like MADS-box protein AGL30 isoform X4 [Carya illinoinensis]|nr:agamous-like MADS-box protein AGL30 isoform X4 [Carya illinoinensis]